MSVSARDSAPRSVAGDNRLGVLPPKPLRRTTKRFVWANILAAWGTLWAALAFAPDALEWIATPVLLLIVGIFGFYTGTGTADMFATLRAQPHRQAAPDYGAWSVPASAVDDERGAG